MVVYDFSWFGLLRVQYKVSLLVRTSYSAVVSLLLLWLTSVCGVWLLSLLVYGFLAGSRLREFLTN